MDRFSALKAFTRVVEAGSFTRAADSLNMPNATLSKTIQQLEAHLGVSLLQRTTRRITVTPEGREYYEKARRLLEDLEEIDAAFNTARNKPKGHLRIAIANVGADRLRFLAPVRVGSQIRGVGEIVAVEEIKGAIQSVVRVTIEISGEDKPACVIDTISRYYPESKS